MNYIVKKQNWLATAVVAVLLVGGVVYFVSDPVKAIIDRKVENWTEWTPEKIREYPAEWLMSAQKDLGERQKQLKSRRFSIRKNQFSWEDSFRRSEREVKVLEKYLAVAKERYRTAEQKDAWPVSMRDGDYAESYDRNRLKKEMVAQFRAKDRAKRKVETYKKMVTRAESLTERIDAKQDQISEILLDLALAIEMAKAAEQMTDLTGLSERGKDIQVTVEALMEELDGAFDVHSLPSMNRSLNNDVLFEEIMNKSEAKDNKNPSIHVAVKEAK